MESTEIRMRCAVGDHVRYVDEHGLPVDALVTAVHGPFPEEPLAGLIPCINVVYVSSDKTKHDPYGTQIERASSVQHQTQTTAHGRYWC